MVTQTQIETAINNLLSLNSSRTLLQLNSNTIEKAYEVYILALCVKAVRQVGGTAILRGISSGPNPNTLVFRGAPGHMASTSQDFCFVECHIRDKAFEIHLGVEYEGSSSATHEIDVSFYAADAANICRNTGNLPKCGSKKLIMVFECKFYSSSVPGTGLARSFIGLLRDCSGSRLGGFVSNNATDNSRKYFSNKPGTQPFTNLTPLNQDSEERFTRIIEQELIKWANP